MPAWKPGHCRFWQHHPCIGCSLGSGAPSASQPPLHPIIIHVKAVVRWTRWPWSRTRRQSQRTERTSKTLAPALVAELAAPPTGRPSPEAASKPSTSSPIRTTVNAPACEGSVPASPQPLLGTAAERIVQNAWLRVRHARTRATRRVHIRIATRSRPGRTSPLVLVCARPSGDVVRPTAAINPHYRSPTAHTTTHRVVHGSTFMKPMSVPLSSDSGSEGAACRAEAGKPSQTSVESPAET